MHIASGLSRAPSARRCFRSSAAHGVYGSPPSMLAPASKKVATGGPFGSKGKGAVAGSSETPPPRAPAGGPPPVVGPGSAPVAGVAAAAAPAPAARPASPPPAPARPPRPPPRGGPLLARIHRPEKSILPSAVRGGG